MRARSWTTRRCRWRTPWAGCVQAHASRAEDAYRISACANGEDDKETWEHITQASLMAFAGINAPLHRR